MRRLILLTALATLELVAACRASGSQPRQEPVLESDTPSRSESPNEARPSSDTSSAERPDLREPSGAPLVAHQGFPVVPSDPGEEEFEEEYEEDYDTENDSF